ncbi:MAG: CsgG/HfaB family protein [Saccharospirillaceae bacterium]|nr:CsgG/HfaB family protein [Pseudomonadales bacterium]NRB78343.1 CsgG/HfaB family protein [Saccharospirillaceae bacterium]
MKKVNTHLLVMVGSAALLMSSCATQSNRAISTPVVESAHSDYQGIKQPIVVTGFVNASNYQSGLFSSDEDHMGNQAKTILKSHLQQTNHFKVMDREDLARMKAEAELLGQTQNISGARYTISGSVTEFGRKETSDHQFFGILGSGKQQIAYANVTLIVSDVLTSEVVYSIQGAGEYQLSTREIAGFGGSAGYDSTLNGKVLNFAITEAVNKLVKSLDKNGWAK